MGWIIIGQAEIETSELGEAAFHGKNDVVARAIDDGVNWSTEGSKILEGAIYGQHLNLMRKLLTAGSPVADGTYYIAYDYFREAISDLPARPALLEKIEASRRWPEFNWALVREEVSLARELLHKGVPINERIVISHGMGSLCPIHYAVRKGNFELIELVVEAGADINALTDSGKSPLRLVAENILLSNEQRKKIANYLVP